MRRSGVRFPSAPPPPGRSTLRVSGLRPACRSAATMVLADDGALVPASGMSGSPPLPPYGCGVRGRETYRFKNVCHLNGRFMDVTSWDHPGGSLLKVGGGPRPDRSRAGSVADAAAPPERTRAARPRGSGPRWSARRKRTRSQERDLTGHVEGAPDSCVDGSGGRVSASWRARALPARSPVSFGRSGQTGLHFRQRSRRLAGAEPTPPIPMNEKFLEV